MSLRRRTCVDIIVFYLLRVLEKTRGAAADSRRRVDVNVAFQSRCFRRDARAHGKPLRRTRPAASRVTDVVSEWQNLIVL